jgi:hypothetical protein
MTKKQRRALKKEISSSKYKGQKDANKLTPGQIKCLKTLEENGIWKPDAPGYYLKVDGNDIIITSPFYTYCIKTV